MSNSYCWVACLGDPYDYTVEAAFDMYEDAHNFMTSLGYTGGERLQAEPRDNYQYKMRNEHGYTESAWIMIIPFTKRGAK